MELKSSGHTSKLLVLLAFCIVATTLWYTNNLANKLKIEEQKKVALWAKATKELSDMNNSNYDVGFVFEVVNNNTTVPVIQVNELGDIIAHRNINKPHTEDELQKQVKLMKRKYLPIEIELINGTKEYIYYKDSRLLQNLKNFPFFILSIIAAFIIIAYFAFSNARIAEQNKVWTGMAKESAHQIGTPLSSLLGWLEYLKENKIEQSVTSEIEKDLSRLSVIASRFSKIGSLPKLNKINLIPVLDSSINYMQKRASSKISIRLISNSPQVNAKINLDLFEWVIENIIKNSMDAINETGKIVVKIIENKKTIFIDIIDNGRGVKKTLSKQIFEPGFTSKKRGWGLGLSLVKRIIKDYHKGDVSLLKSTPNQETIIRIVLNK
ncbi:MAG: sensor histidine kinase [Flavobacteriales bacterium TMED191]|nr:MAG: sensor histidine kinase [Flavobacteriales bacterium TMED191]